MPATGHPLRPILRLLGLSLLFCFSGQPLRGQALTLPDRPRYAIEHFGDRYGLGTATITALAQDQEGFLWIGTQTGLFRYDGMNVKRFGEDDGLLGQHVDQLLVAPDGRVWVRTRKGIARFARPKFVAISLPSEAGRLRNVFQSFALDNAGAIFMATEQGLLRIDGNDGQSRLYRRQDGLPSDQVEAIVQGPDDSIWFAAGRRIGRFSPSSRQPEILDSLQLPDDGVRALEIDGQRNLWVRTNYHLATLDAKAAASRLVFQDRGIPGANMYGGPSLDRHGNLMLPSANGLYRRVGEAWQVINQKNGLTSSAVFSALEDREGGIWVGLAGAGLDRWPGSKQWSGWTDAEGLPDSLVLRVLRDHRGRLWVGTNTALAIWEAQQHRWRTWTAAKGLSGSGVSELLMTRDEAIWLLSYHTGVTRFDASSGRLVPLRVPSPKRDWPVVSMAAAPDGSVWVSTESELSAIRFNHGNFVTENVPIAAEASGTTSALSFSPSGALWTAGPGGVSRYEGGHWRRYGQSDGLLGNNVQEITAVGDEEIWIGYQDEDSITRARISKDGRMSTVHYKQGSCLLGVDRNSNIWMEMERGAGVLSPDGTLRNFTQADGLLWDDVNCGAFWPESDGTVLIGTSRGLARYDPAQDRQSFAAPPVVLTSVRFGSNERLGETDPRVAFRDRAFQAEFAALTFRNPDRLTCRYRLRGLEKDFIETNLREARYASLPPGEYTFEVLCGSAGLGWKGQPAVYSFILLPPWWQNWWTRLAGLLLSVLLIWGVTQYRTQMLRRERARLEAAVAARSAELAKANAELQEASLTDPLTGVRNQRFFQTTIAADVNQAVRAYRAGPDGWSTDHRDLIFYLIDLDHFKEVNDEYGHDAGDRILMEIAKRLNQIVRKSDFLIRWGGEEFLVVCRSAERREARMMAEKILAAIADRPFEVGDGRIVRRTCSMGWAPFPWLSASPAVVRVEDVLKLADRGLYLAKERGRNQAIGILPGEKAEQTGAMTPDHGEESCDGELVAETCVLGPAAVRA